LQRFVRARVLRLARTVVPWRARGRLVARARKVHRRLTTPLVTVVVTTQDSEGWVRRCVRSIRRQQHRRLQIVVVDAASGDATREIVRELAAADRRITVPGRGRGAQRRRRGGQGPFPDLRRRR
jgi:hypothetical protein